MLGDAGAVLAVDATGLVVPASGRVVAVIGLDDVVVVDTPDALLVTTRARAQDVKQIVAELKEAAGGPDLGRLGFETRRTPLTRGRPTLSPGAWSPGQARATGTHIAFGSGESK